jgi:putative ABC transport system permease protein
MGTNLLQIDPAPSMRNGISGAANINLSERDVEVLRRSPLLAAVEPSVDGRVQIVGGNSNWNTRILGTTPNGLAIRNYSIASGRMFTDQEVASSRKICVLGATVASVLFPSAEAAYGQEVRIANVPMIVVGVLLPKGFNANGFDQDDIVVGPITTIQKRIKGTTWLDDIYVTTPNSALTSTAMADITDLLRLTHKLTGKNDDFRIRSQVEIAQAAEASTGTLTTLLASAAAISLIVGGIGIMNIMFVVVTERTREIGIRKSIGAKSRLILTQFMIEALVLSLTGGIIGVVAGHPVHDRSACPEPYRRDYRCRCWYCQQLFYFEQQRMGSHYFTVCHNDLSDRGNVDRPVLWILPRPKSSTARSDRGT